MLWLSTFSNGFRQVKIKQTFCKIFFWPMLLLELGWHGGKNLLLANQQSLLQERKRPFKTGKWSLMIFKQTLIKLSTKNWKDLGSYKDLCPICDFSSCLWYREVENYHRVEYISLFVYLCFSHIAKKKKKKNSFLPEDYKNIPYIFSKFIKHCLSPEWKSKKLLYATYKHLKVAIHSNLNDQK